MQAAQAVTFSRLIYVSKLMFISNVDAVIFGPGSGFGAFSFMNKQINK